MHISQKIKLFRKAYKYNQEDIASKLKCTRSTIANYETGRSTPPVSFLQFMSNESGLPVDVFVDNDKDLHIVNNGDNLLLQQKPRSAIYSTENEHLADILNEPDEVYVDELSFLRSENAKLKAQVAVLKEVIQSLKMVR